MAMLGRQLAIKYFRMCKSSYSCSVVTSKMWNFCLRGLSQALKSFSTHLKAKCEVSIKTS
jgi:hypothetical protein